MLGEQLKKMDWVEYYKNVPVMEVGFFFKSCIRLA